MAFQTDVPPHKSAEPVETPPPVSDPNPNMAMLKGDIDSGRTGDKVEVFDPGMAMLGTCEEAAGTPLTPEQIKFAREQEAKHRWSLGRPKNAAAHDRDDRGVRYGFVGLIAAIAVIAVLGVMWLS